MRQFYILFLLVWLGVTGFSQLPHVVWGNKIGSAGGGDEGTGIVADDFGNSYSVGYIMGDVTFDTINAVASNRNPYVLKRNSADSAVWAFCFPGIGVVTKRAAIAIDKTGNIYVTGTFFGNNVDFDPHPLNSFTLSSNSVRAAFVAKYNGNLSPDDPAFFQWAFTLGGTVEGNGNGIIVDSIGNVYVTGMYDGLNADFDPHPVSTAILPTAVKDVFVAKYDGTTLPSLPGFYLWAFGFGAAASDAGMDVDVDANGKVYVTGFFSNTNVDVNPDPLASAMLSSAGQTDIFVLRYDGTLLPADPAFYEWSFSMGAGQRDEAFSLDLDDNDFLYVAGDNWGGSVDFDPSGNTTTLPYLGQDDGFVAKYNCMVPPSDPSFYQWAFSIGGTSLDKVNCVTADDSGRVYVAGEFSTTNVDFDPNFTNSSLLSSSGQRDFFVARYNGNLLPSDPAFHEWSFGGGGVTIDVGNSVAISNTHQLHVTGYFSDINVDLNPDPGAALLVHAIGVSPDIFISRFQADLSPTDPAFFVGASGYGNGGNISETHSIVADIWGNVYESGFFTGRVDFDPSQAVFTLETYSGKKSAFVAKYNAIGNFIWAFQIEPTTGDNEVLDIAVDSNLMIYISGVFRGDNVDFDPHSVNTAMLGGPIVTILPDLFVAKYNGNYTPADPQFHQWSFDVGVGGNADEARSLVVDENGFVYVTGSFQGASTDFNPHPVDSDVLASIGGSYIAKYNGNLTPASSSFFVWAFGVEFSKGNSLARSPAGRLYLTGHFESTNMEDFDPHPVNTAMIGLTGVWEDIFVSCYDGNFTPADTNFYQWAFTVGGYTDWGNDIAVDSSEALYVTGYFDGTQIDFDPHPVNINPLNPPNPSAFLARYQGDLTPDDPAFHQWAFAIGDDSAGIGGGWTMANGISLDDSGNVYITGQFEGDSSEFDPSPVNSFYLSNLSSNEDIFVAKYDRNLLPTDPGFFQYAFVPHGTGVDRGKCIYALPADAFLISGIFGGLDLDFDPTPLYYPLSSSLNFHSGFTVRYLESPPPNQPAYLSGNNVVCAGSVQTFTVVNDPTASGYTWTLPIGWTGSSTTNSITVTTSGSSGIISVTANNVWGASVPQTFIVTVEVPPVAQFTTGGGNTTFTFTDNSLNNPTSWYWDFGDGTNSTLANPTHTFTSTSTFVVCLTATNSCGVDVSCDSISACVVPSSGYSHAVNGLTVTFSDFSTGGPATWQWDFGDNTSSITQNPVHTFPAPGLYIVCVIVGNPCGFDTICDTVVINCIPPTANYAYAANSNTVNFTDGSSNSNGYTYDWDFGDGTTSTFLNPVHTFPAPGVYYVCLTVFGNCGANTFCDSVYVNCLIPVADFSATGSIQLMSFSDQSLYAPTSWYWDFGDGTNSSLQNPTHVFSAMGQYYVCLYVSSICGDDSLCQATDVFTGLENPNGFSDLMVFPNPSAGLFTLQTETELDVQVTDPFGRVLFNAFFTPGKNFIDLSEQANGVYLLTVSSKYGSKTFQLVKIAD